MNKNAKGAKCYYSEETQNGGFYDGVTSGDPCMTNLQESVTIGQPRSNSHSYTQVLYLERLKQVSLQTFFFRGNIIHMIYLFISNTS